MQREDGWKNCRTSYGRIEPLLGGQLEKTSFLMSYGAEVVIPIETGFPTLRTQSFNPNNNDKLLERSVDLIEDRRESAEGKVQWFNWLTININSNKATMPM